jgi:hypothetical protein
MIQAPFPADSLFIKFLWIQIGATGPLALGTVIVIATGFFLGRVLKLW